MQRPGVLLGEWGRNIRHRERWFYVKFGAQLTDATIPAGKEYEEGI